MSGALISMLSLARSDTDSELEEFANIRESLGCRRAMSSGSVAAASESEADAH